MSAPGTDFSRPLAVLFHEVDLDGAAVAKALERLELRVERFTDPRAFLLRIRHSNAALCFVDAATPKSDVASAVMKTITSFFGRNPPMLVLVRAGDQKTIDKVLQLGARVAIDKPIQLRDLAKKLTSYVATNAISELLGGKFPPDTAGATSVHTKSARPQEPAEAPIPKVPIPELVGWHFEKILPILAELSGALDTFEVIEDQLKYYADRLVPKREEVVKMVQTMRKSQEKLDLLQSLRMYGAANARNLVAAMALGAAAKVELVKFDPRSGLLSADAAKTIPYAAKAVEHFGEGSRYQQVAFNSGLVFDLLSLVCEGLGERKRPTVKFLQACYAAALKRADKGFRLGKALSDLALDRHIVSTLMMREAGKVAMAIFYKDYVDVAAVFEKRGIRPMLQHVVEQKHYSIAHNLIGALLCQGTPGLGAAYKAVLFCDYPFLLKAGGKGDADAYALAKLCQSL